MMQPPIPLGVCVLPPPPPNAARTVSYPRVILDVLRHAGVCFEEIPFSELEARLPEIGVLVTVGDSDSAALRTALRGWVEGGGGWLSVAGLCGLADLFGVEAVPPSYSLFAAGCGTLGEGYLAPDHRLHALLSHITIPLHYFNGLPVRSREKVLASVLDAHGRPTHRAALVEATPRAGHCLLVAPDVTGAIVRIRQGVAITRDGVPSPDGTAPQCDDVCKSDDGAVLDWYFDREAVRGVQGLMAFTQPVADQWAELLLRCIFHLASSRNLPLPVLWLYPRNLPAIAHLSHDSDLNEPDKALRMLEVLDSLGVRSTWCVVLPGYPAEVMQAIKDAGHELAVHFDAMTDGCPFTEREFARQHQALVDLFGGSQPVTNKNHYLRWEGDTEFFRWLVKRGIRLDESKGASKTGEAGFLFGTCHPYLPVDAAGKTLDVLELPTLTQDLMVFAPRELLGHLLEGGARCHGVPHFLFHPAHIDKPGVEDALRATIAGARARGMEWWTAQAIDAWERARRGARWSAWTANPARAGATLMAPDALDEATVMWLAPGFDGLTVDDQPVHTEDVLRWGFHFQAAVVSVHGEHRVEVARRRPAEPARPATEAEG